MTANIENNIEETQKIQSENIVDDNKIAPSTQAADSQEEKPEDVNWRAFREARKLDRQKREEAERKAAEKEAEVAALKAAMEAAFARNTPPNPPAYSQTYQQDPYEETEDQRIEKKVQAALAAKEAEMERRRKEEEYKTYPQRLKQNYSDFDNVVSQDNLDYIDYHYPEISRTLGRLQDGYEKWSDVYHTIKKLVPNHSNARNDMKRAEQNLAKPKSMSSSGVTQSNQPTQGAHILSEERKRANWERMQRTMNTVDTK